MPRFPFHVSMPGPCSVSWPVSLPVPPFPPFTPTPGAPPPGLPLTAPTLNVFNEVFTAVLAIASGLLLAYLNSKRQVHSEDQTRLQQSRQEVSSNWSMAMGLMKDSVGELRAEAQAARAASAAAEARLKELRGAFRAFGEEALRQAPSAQWSRQSMDTLFALGLSIASVERARDRVSGHVERIADKAAEAGDALSQMEDVTQALATDDVQAVLGPQSEPESEPETKTQTERVPAQPPGEEPDHDHDHGGEAY